MTELTITPNYAKKTAKFAGTVAAGEHVAVTVKSASTWPTTNLRLRVIGIGKTLAIFPLPVTDVGDADAVDAEDNDSNTNTWVVSGTDLTCELNLNTVQMLGALRQCIECDLLVVLDDPDGHIVYFKDVCSFQHWPKRTGDDEPYDLDAFPGQIEEWQTAVGNIAASVTKVGTTATISITDKNGTTTTATVSDGAQGTQGPAGPAGADGRGVPNGGTTGQVLAKRSNADGDTQWADGGGIGAHASTHATTGTDPITPASIGAPTAAELTAHTGATNNPHGVTAAQVGAYVKPNGGIPATDMAAAVQTALTAAANAAPQANTYTKTETNALVSVKPWIANHEYAVKDLVSYNGLLYSCLEAHRSGALFDLQKFYEFIYEENPALNPVARMSNLPYSLDTATAPTTRTVITKVLAAGATSDSYTLPAIDGEADTVQNCDIVVDARACTGDSIALTLTPTGTNIILYPGGNAPTLKKGTVTVIDCTSVKLGDDLVWLVMGATEMQAAS